MTEFIFDVDGTLTPARETINPEFKAWFLNWQDTHNTYLVTGSDYEKTLEQVGIEVINKAKYVFNCAGNEVRHNGKIVYQSDWLPDDDLINACIEELQNSPYTAKTGNHFEIRTGSANFSIVGRKATMDQRKHYNTWDNGVGERKQIITRLMEKFSHIECALGGETSIDIYPIGRDKSQILKYITGQPIMFFGDTIYPGGNDYNLAADVDLAHKVEDWQHTWMLLKMMKKV